MVMKQLSRQYNPPTYMVEGAIVSSLTVPAAVELGRFTTAGFHLQSHTPQKAHATTMACAGTESRSRQGGDLGWVQPQWLR